MTRRIDHLGNTWDVRPVGTGAGARFGPTYWRVDFACLSDPAKGVFSGKITEADPNRVSLAELQHSLEDALILDALEHAPDGLTVAEITTRVPLSAEAVEERLLHLVDDVDEDVLSEGVPRYIRRERRT